MSKNMALPVLFTMLLGSSLSNAAIAAAPATPYVLPLVKGIALSEVVNAGVIGSVGAFFAGLGMVNGDLDSVNVMTDFSSYDNVPTVDKAPVVVEKTSFQKVSDAVKAHPYITAASVSAIAVVVYAVAKKLQDKKEASQEADFVRSQVITA